MARLRIGIESEEVRVSAGDGLLVAEVGLPDVGIAHGGGVLLAADEVAWASERAFGECRMLWHGHSLPDESAQVSIPMQIVCHDGAEPFCGGLGVDMLHRQRQRVPRIR